MTVVSFTPEYRECTTCPAPVALFNSIGSASDIHTSKQGRCYELENTCEAQKATYIPEHPSIAPLSPERQPKSLVGVEIHPHLTESSSPLSLSIRRFADLHMVVGYETVSIASCSSSCGALFDVAHDIFGKAVPC